jgi:hypothetical protein
MGLWVQSLSPQKKKKKRDRERKISSLVWWFQPTISATQEAEVRGSQSKAHLGKSIRPYLKSKLTKKEIKYKMK